MNILNIMNKINSIGKYLALFVLAINFLSVVNATTAPTGLTSALTQLCVLSQQFLGITVMLLIVLAGTIYAIGQILGAETRARAAVWATAMLTGAVIGVLIYILTPWLVSLLLTGQGMAITPTNPCGGATAGTGGTAGE